MIFSRPGAWETHTPVRQEITHSCLTLPMSPSFRISLLLTHCSTPLLLLQIEIDASVRNKHLLLWYDYRPATAYLCLVNSYFGLAGPKSYQSLLYSVTYTPHIVQLHYRPALPSNRNQSHTSSVPSPQW